MEQKTKKQMSPRKRRWLIIGGIAAFVLIAAAVVLIVVLSGKNCKNHKDKDQNGVCDKCGAKLGIKIDFYAINDLHGKFDDSSQQPGVDELSLFLREEQMIKDNVVLLSSGDMWQGTSESNQTKGEILVDWMNELGFVSQTLGNHEFDWGEEFVANNAAKANFPFLAINVMDRKTGARVSYAKPSVMVETGGVKIGIIGAIGDCYSSIAAEKSAGFEIVTGSALSRLIKEEADRLRADGADVIVLSIHDGYDESFPKMHVLPDNKIAGFYDVSLSKDTVDLVFEGHTHQSYVIMDSFGVYHLQNGGENKGISHAVITVNPATGVISVDTAEIIASNVYAMHGQDGLRDRLLEKYADKIAWTKEVSAVLPTQMNRDDLRRLVAQLYYERGVEEWGDEYDIVLGGGFISARSPGYLTKGKINYSMIQSVFPFDNELVLCKATGLQLNQVFFKSNNENYFVYCGEYGEQVRKNIEYNKTYYIIVDSYTSTYAPNGLIEVKRLNAEIYARDLLNDYFKKNYGIEK